MKRVLYILVQWSWGLPATLVGLFATLYALLFRHGKAHRNHLGIITEFGGNWGGVSLGMFQLCGSYSQDYPCFFNETKDHEYGHSLQNMIYGVFYIFVIGIPSFIRYNLYNAGKLKGGYYDIWFERQATKWGATK